MIARQLFLAGLQQQPSPLLIQHRRDKQRMAMQNIESKLWSTPAKLGLATEQQQMGMVAVNVNGSFDFTDGLSVLPGSQQAADRSDPLLSIRFQQSSCLFRIVRRGDEPRKVSRVWICSGVAPIAGESRIASDPTASTDAAWRRGGHRLGGIGKAP